MLKKLGLIAAACVASAIVMQGCSSSGGDAKEQGGRDPIKADTSKAASQDNPGAGKAKAPD